MDPKKRYRRGVISTLHTDNGIHLLNVREKLFDFDFEEEEEGKEKLASSTAKDIRSRFIFGPFVIESGEEMVKSLMIRPSLGWPT